jgi:uncharacterized protein with WD repeat
MYFLSTVLLFFLSTVFTYNAKIASKSFENVAKFKLFWDDDNSSVLYACRNQMQTKFTESLLLFGDSLLSVHFG